MFRAIKSIRRTTRTVLEEPIPVGLLVKVVGVPEVGVYEIQDQTSGVVLRIERREFDSHFVRIF